MVSMNGDWSWFESEYDPIWDEVWECSDVLSIEELVTGVCRHCGCDLFNWELVCDNCAWAERLGGQDQQYL
jgi:hypothetical protein